MSKYEPWQPITDSKTLRVLGKMGEESCELGKIICRSIIQGLDGKDPHANFKLNREAIFEELSDVAANSDLVLELLEPSVPELLAMRERVAMKKEKLREWQNGDLDD